MKILSIDYPLIISFTQFIKTLQRKFKNILAQPQAEVSHYLPQYLFVCDDDDNIIVNYVAKYEEGLENGLLKVFNKIGFNTKEPIKLTKSNSTSHNREHFSKYYTPETQKIVYSLYEKDFTIFGYKKELF